MIDLLIIDGLVGGNFDDVAEVGAIARALLLRLMGGLFDPTVSPMTRFEYLSINCDPVMGTIFINLLQI